jgi:hypothetical protein
MFKVKERYTLKVEANSSPESSLTLYHATHRHIAEDSNFPEPCLLRLGGGESTFSDR